MAIRLALTAPSIFDESEWKNNHLRASEHSSAWSAAQQILGTWRWNSEELLENTHNGIDKNQNHDNDENDDLRQKNNNELGHKAPDVNEDQGQSVNRSESDTAPQKTGNQSVNFDETTIDPKHCTRLFIQKMTIETKTTNSPLSKDYDRKKCSLNGDLPNSLKIQ